MMHFNYSHASLNDGNTFCEMHCQVVSSVCEHFRVYLHKPTQYSLLHTQATLYSLLLLGYKPVQHVTVLNTLGNCNTIVSNIILYYNVMGPPSYVWSILDRNIIMRCTTVKIYTKLLHNLQSSSFVMAVKTDRCINRISMCETNTA